MQQPLSTSATGSDSNTSDLFRDGCKAIMSILVILTNDCGKLKVLLDMK
jgi:hypothetical protein